MREHACSMDSVNGFHTCNVKVFPSIPKSKGHVERHLCATLYLKPCSEVGRVGRELLISKRARTTVA